MKYIEKGEEVDYKYFGWVDIEANIVPSAHKRLKELNIEIQEIVNRKTSTNVMSEFVELNKPQLFKTLVLKDKKEQLYAFAVPVDSKLDYSKSAKLLGTSRLKFVDNLYELTGFQHGSCSLFGLDPDKFKLVIDESCLEHDFIWISTGRLTYSMALKTEDLKKANLIFAPILKEN